MHLINLTSYSEGVTCLFFSPGLCVLSAGPVNQHGHVLVSPWQLLPFEGAGILGLTWKSLHAMSSWQYPLEMAPSYSEIHRLVVFSHPDMCRCYQHTELRLCFNSKAYLPRIERVGKKYWSNTDGQYFVFRQNQEGAAKPANGKMSSLSVGLFFVLNCDPLNLCIINICTI